MEAISWWVQFWCIWWYELNFVRHGKATITGVLTWLWERNGKLYLYPMEANIKFKVKYCDVFPLHIDARDFIFVFISLSIYLSIVQYCIHPRISLGSLYHWSIIGNWCDIWTLFHFGNPWYAIGDKISEDNILNSHKFSIIRVCCY